MTELAPDLHKYILDTLQDIIKGIEISEGINLPYIEQGLSSGDSQDIALTLFLFSAMSQKGKLLSSSAISKIEERLFKETIVIPTLGFDIQEIGLISVILGLQSGNHNHKLNAPSLLKMAELINRDSVNQDTAANFVETLGHQIELGVISAADVQSEIEKCCTQADIKKKEICARIETSLLEKKDFLQGIEGGLDKADSRGFAVQMLFGAKSYIASEEVTQKLANIVSDGGQDEAIRFKSAVIIQRSYESKRLNEDVLLELRSALKYSDKNLLGMLCGIFLQQSEQGVKLDQEITDYYQGKLYGDESEILHGSVILVSQINKGHLIKLAEANIAHIAKLTSQEDLGEETRRILLGILASQAAMGKDLSEYLGEIKKLLKGSKSAQLQDGCIEVISKILKLNPVSLQEVIEVLQNTIQSKEYSYAARNNAVISILNAITKGAQATSGTVLLLESILEDGVVKDNNEIRLGILQVILQAVIDQGYVPELSSLRSFESLLLEDSGNLKQSLLLIKATLKKYGALSDSAITKLMEVVRDEEKPDDVKKIAIEAVGLHLKNSNKLHQFSKAFVVALEGMAANSNLSKQVFFTLEIHITKGGKVSNGILEKIVFSKDIKGRIEFLTASLKNWNYEINNKKIEKFLSYALCIGNTDEASREEIYKILKKNEGHLDVSSKVILKQEEIARSLGKKETVSESIEQLKVYIDAGYKVTWNLLIALGKELAGEARDQIYEILSNRVDYGQDLPAGLVVAITEQCIGGQVCKVDLLIKLAARNTENAGKILDALTIAVLDQNISNELEAIKALTGLVASTGFAEPKLIFKVSEYLKGNTEVKQAALEFLNICLESGIKLPEEAYGQARQCLVTDDEQLRYKILKFYKNVAEKGDINSPTEFIELLRQGKDEGEIVKILAILEAQGKLDAQQLAILAITEAALNLKSDLEVAKKVQSIEKLTQHIGSSSEEDLIKITGILKEGLAYRNREMLHACSGGLSKIMSQGVPVKFNQDEVNLIIWALKIGLAPAVKLLEEIIAFGEARAVLTGFKNELYEIAKLQKDEVIFNRLIDVLQELEYENGICPDDKVFPFEPNDGKSDKMENLIRQRQAIGDHEKLAFIRNNILNREVSVADLKLLEKLREGYKDAVNELSWLAICNNQTIPLILILQLTNTAEEVLNKIIDLDYSEGFFGKLVSRLEGEFLGKTVVSKELLELFVKISKKNIGFSLESIKKLEQLLPENEYLVGEILNNLNVYSHYKDSEVFRNYLYGKLNSLTTKESLISIDGVNLGYLTYVLYTLFLVSRLPGVTKEMMATIDLSDKDNITRNTLLLAFGIKEIDSIKSFHERVKKLETAYDYQGLSVERDDQLRILYDWSLVNGKQELNRAVELLIYHPDTLKLLTQNLEISKIEDEVLWLKLQRLLPNAILKREDFDELKGFILNLGWETQGEFFDNIKGLKTIEKLKNLMSFIEKYKVDNSILNELLSDWILIDKIYKQLNYHIALKELSKFHFDIKSWNDFSGAIEKISHWKIEPLLRVIKALTAQNAESWLQSVKALSEYKISADVRNKSGLTADDIFNKLKSSEWYFQIRKLGIEANFSDYAYSKSIDRLLKEIEEKNAKNPAIKELVSNSHGEYLKDHLLAIHEAEKSDSKIAPIGKVISLWEEPDIIEWAGQLKEGKHDIAEVLAVIKRATYLIYGYEPRPVQILSAIILYHTEGRSAGRLAEISTGEGKSIIVAMFAILKVLEGRTIDIVTSSEVLAQRDAKEQARIFNTFGISVGENTEKSEGKKDCYDRKIVYGDIRNYVGDILKHEYEGTNIRGERKFDIVIVDEVDSMLIDGTNHIVMLAKKMPSFEYLEQVLAAVWQYLQQVMPKFVHLEDKLFWVDGEFEKGKSNLRLLEEEGKAYEVTNQGEFLKSLLEGYIRELIKNDQKLVFIPTHLKTFVESQVEHWSLSALKALSMKEKVDYIIAYQEGEKSVKPLDGNTGVIQSNMQWGNGLHQFLQIKHGIKLAAENLIASFMSNMAFFKRYGAEVYGVSGTLGAQKEHDLLHSMYGVDFVSIPTYKPKQFIELPPILAAGTSEWIGEIMNSIRREAAQGRAILVIAETIKDAEVLAELLVMTGYPANKVKKYTRNDNEEASVVEDRIDVGEVIIATNLAGRGTDIKTTVAVEKNGGLHVCLTFLPDNLRVQEQAYGRTARQGNLGTAQMIIDYENKVHELKQRYPWYEASTVEELIRWRDVAENERLMRDEYFNVSMMALKDELFARFMSFINKKDIKSAVRGQIEESWGFWLKEQQEIMEYKFDKKIATGDAEVMRKKILEIQEKVKNSFEIFLGKIADEINKDNVIKNPSYYVKRGLAEQSQSDMDRAIAIDDVYSFAAYYAKARVAIMQSEEDKGGALKNLYMTKAKIEGNMIPQLEGLYHLTNLRNTDGGRELSKQILDKIDLFKKLVEAIDKAISVIEHSSGEEKIRISGTKSLMDLLGGGDDPNRLKVDEDTVAEFQNIGVADVFEVETYKEDNGWFGSVFAFFAGFIQIVIGAVITIGSAGLAANWGIGMIVEGVSDIIASIKSVISGEGINLDEYFKNKGISYAINLIALGFDYIKNLVTEGFKVGTKEAGKEVAKNAAKTATQKWTTEAVVMEVKDQLIKRSLIKGATYIAEVIGGDILDDKRDKIEGRVRDKITSLFERHSADLQKILAAGRQNELIQEAIHILKQYAGKYKSVALTIAKGVASKIIPGISPAIKAAEIGLSYDKISDTTNEFCERLSAKIANIASQITSQYLMQHKLFVYYNRNVVNGITNTLNAQGLFNKKVLANGDCEGVASYDLGEHQPLKAQVIMICLEVYTSENMDYTEKVKSLKGNISGFIANSIISMIRNELIEPIADTASTYGVSHLLENMEKAKQDIAEKFTKKPADIKDEDDRQTDTPVPHTENKASSTPLSEKDARELEQFAKNIKESKIGGYTEAEILANSLGKRIEVYKNGKFDIGIDPKSANEQPGYKKTIKLNYDSTKGKWTSPHTIPGSIYEQVARQTLYSEYELREMSGNYIQKDPALAKDLLGFYKLSQLISQPTGRASKPIQHPANDNKPSVPPENINNQPTETYGPPLPPLSDLVQAINAFIPGAQTNEERKSIENIKDQLKNNPSMIDEFFGIPKGKIDNETIEKFAAYIAAKWKSIKAEAVAEGKTTLEYINTECPDCKSYLKQFADNAKSAETRGVGMKFFPDGMVDKGVEFTQELAEWVGVGYSYLKYKTTDDLREALEGITAVYTLWQAGKAGVGKLFDFDKPFKPHVDAGDLPKKVETGAGSTATKLDDVKKEYKPKIDLISNDYHLETPATKIKNGDLVEINIADKKMYQSGDHFNKHGRSMGYQSKKEYEQAARDFAGRYKEDGFDTYVGKWGDGLKTARQVIISNGQRSVIIDAGTGQIISFYEGMELRGLTNIQKLNGVKK